MRSKDNTVDSPGTEVLVTKTTHDMKNEEDGNIMDIERSIKVKQPEDKKTFGSGKDNKSTQNEDQMFGLRDLSKDDLLKVLEIMEGEIQMAGKILRWSVLPDLVSGTISYKKAGEDVILLLRSEMLSRPEELESRYGSARPSTPLKALQRDSVLSNNHMHHDNVYEKPMAKLDRLRDKHKESYQCMLKQLLLAEKSYRHTVYELETEKRKHVEYMNKSDDFTNLLEQERERLKRLLKQEKAYQIQKEKDFSKRMRRTSGELVKLKSFALMMVDEHELHLEKIDKQSKKIQDLLQKLQEKEQKLNEAKRKTKEDSQLILDLEVELELRTSKFAKEQEEMSAKLSFQESQHKPLSQKQTELSCKSTKLIETNEMLQKSAEELQGLRDEIRKGECGNSNLMAEFEMPCKNILKMEDKDDELTKTENKCNELKKKLHAEETHNKELRLEVEKLQERMTQLEKLETILNKGRTEYGQLQVAFDKEKSLTKDLTDELVSLKIRMKELESSELKLEKEELDLKEDLMKLKSITVIIVNKHKNIADIMRSEEKKKEELNRLFKAEREKVMEVTEKLFEESKKCLKLKSEMELKIACLVKERDEIKGRLTKAEEQCQDMHSKLFLIKHTTDEINKKERNSTIKAQEQSVLNASGKDENKVEELTLEIERMKTHLHLLEAFEGDLIKSQDENEMLEKTFPTELEKIHFLSRQVKENMSQTVLSKAIERGEAGCQEEKLRHRFMMEVAKTRNLQEDVQALKEKIYGLVNKEDELSKLQVDFSILQKRLLEEEDKKRSLSNEVLNLTKELEVTKCYSCTLWPCSKGSQMMEFPLTSTGVQTDLIENRTTDNDIPVAFIKKSVQEEICIMSSLQQKNLKKAPQRPTVRELYPLTDFTMKKSWIPWMKKKDSSVSKVSLDTSEESAPSKVNVSKKHDQSLHDQVVPDLQKIFSEEALQFSNSNSNNFITQATATQSQEIQKPQTIISTNERIKEPKNPELARSPMTIATISRLKNPQTVRSLSMDKSFSPVSTASNSISPEPMDMITGRAVFKVTPEKRIVPTPIKKCRSHANIITTEDSKINIHCSSQFKKPTENHGSVITAKSVSVTSKSKEASTETALRSAHTVSKSLSKLTSNITITQVTKAPARPTLSMLPVHVPSALSGFTCIPISHGMKTGKAVLEALGISTGVKMETHAENQAMNTELKKQL